MSLIINLDTWESPASKYPRKKVGHASINTYYYSPAAYECYGVRDHKFFRATKRLRITNLRINKKTWMVDDPPHWWGMEEHAQAMQGHVVCAGLGLGLMVHALAANPKVTKITVVEIHRDVIRLVKPLVPDCEIVHGNFWEWKGNPDGVLFDLFTGRGRDLASAAVSVYIDLYKRFESAKTIRIHGMNNSYLEKIRLNLSESAMAVVIAPPSFEAIEGLKELLKRKEITTK